MIVNIFIITFICTSQFVGTSIIKVKAPSYSFDDFSDSMLIDSIKNNALNSLTLFNEKDGIFLWNIQNLQNISRYGDAGNLTNSEESLEDLNTKSWLQGLTQDILMQYLLLKYNVKIALNFVGSQQDQMDFNRNWIFMTEKIMNWLYYQVAVNDQLMTILYSLSENHNGFDEFWNALIRPKYNDFLKEKIALLPDTLVLGSKILKAAEFMPFFSPHEEYFILLTCNSISKWWNAINLYALSDPKFAVAGIGKSLIQSQSSKWSGWQKFLESNQIENFIPADIFTENFIDFRNYLYTSPQIANIYLTYIKKMSAGSSFKWDDSNYYFYDVNNANLLKTLTTICNDYANHITWIDNKTTYFLAPETSEMTWIGLNELYNGYSYVWNEYLIDIQDSANDFNQYLSGILPLKITNTRTFQGAGDIKGLIDIYYTLSQGFVYDSVLQKVEISALNIMEQILNSQRLDGSYVLCPYFGSLLDTEIFIHPLINDAELVYPTNLPKDFRNYIGTMTIMKFLLHVKTQLEKLRSSIENEKIRLTQINNFIDSTLVAMGNLIVSKIDEKTLGIPKQAIIYNKLINPSSSRIFKAEPITITIDLKGYNLLIEELPSWIYYYNMYTNLGKTRIYQWEYLSLLKDLYIRTKDSKFLDPIFEAMKIFDNDFQNDNQYQLTAICEGKDGIVRTFFKVSFTLNTLELKDESGYFDYPIPLAYRADIYPVTSTYASETPQEIRAMILMLLPLLTPVFESNINQIAIIGFLTGLIMTISIIYIKRPKYQ